MHLKRIGFLLLAAVLILSACAPAPTGAPRQPPASPTPFTAAPPALKTPPSPIGIPATPPASSALLNPASAAAQKALAQKLGIDPASIQVLSVEAVDWPDACLGVTRPGMLCAQVITPGYRVMLAAQGRRYEIHTDDAGRQALPAEPPGASTDSPSTDSQGSGAVLLFWERNGGIAGFCDHLTIYAGGAVNAASCRFAQTEKPTPAALTPAQMQTLSEFQQRLQSFQVEHSDKAAADAMTIRLQFNGSGAQPFTPADEAALQRFAEEVFQSVRKNSGPVTP